ncbi:MAG: phytoene desaturase family protein [Anaerolineales bacterium]
MKNKRVIVIGAGIGGLTASIHLARAGFEVTVIEKNDIPGGRCDQLSMEGHTFDTGPTLLVMPLLYEKELKTLGVSMDEMLDLIRVDPTYHLVFDDGSQLALSSDMAFMEKQLEAMEVGSFQNFQRYLDEGQRHYHLGIEKLIYPDFRKPSDFYKLNNLPLVYQVLPLAKHYAHMSKYFDNPRLKSAFTFQDVYMGLSPFEAPATFSLMPYTEMVHGVWYPKGGMYQIVNALMSLAQDAGVEFQFNIDVRQIDLDGARARGVFVNGHQLEADIVLANADLPYVCSELIPNDKQVKRLARKKYSCSVISFFWGVDKNFEALSPHTLFLADDYRDNFVSIIKELDLPSNPSLYIHAPTRLDPSMAPAGEDTLTAIVPVGHMSEDSEQDWGDIRDEAREHVFRRLRLLGIDDLEEHVKFEINFTPPSWKKRYNLVKGSTHGLCHNLSQLGPFRPDFEHPDYDNLYFTGASTRPGTGLPTAIISGRMAAERIIGNLNGHRN